jgi:hypothetical protein
MLLSLSHPSTGSVILKVNPWVEGAIFILDATGGSDYIYDRIDANMDRITW